MTAGGAIRVRYVVNAAGAAAGEGEPAGRRRAVRGLAAPGPVQCCSTGKLGPPAAHGSSLATPAVRHQGGARRPDHARHVPARADGRCRPAAIRATRRPTPTRSPAVRAAAAPASPRPPPRAAIKVFRREPAGASDEPPPGAARHPGRHAAARDEPLDRRVDRPRPSPSVRSSCCAAPGSIRRQARRRGGRSPAVPRLRTAQEPGAA